jgi:hypothetical protein
VVEREPAVEATLRLGARDADAMAADHGLDENSEHEGGADRGDRQDEREKSAI